MLVLIGYHHKSIGLDSVPKVVNNALTYSTSSVAIDPATNSAACVDLAQLARFLWDTHAIAPSPRNSTAPMLLHLVTGSLAKSASACLLHLASQLSCSAAAKHQVVHLCAI
jgi:hypothetical protein